MKTSPRAICGWIGIVAGMLSLAFALLPAKLAPVITPPKPIEQSIVDRAKALRDRAVALIRGAEERPSAAAKPTNWDDVFAAATMTLGFAGFVLGILSFVRREDLRTGTGAAMLGTAGIAFERLSVGVAMLGAIVILTLVAARKETR